MNGKRKIYVAVSVTVIVTAILTFLTTSYLYSVGSTPKLGTALSILDKYYYKEIDTNAFDEAATRAAVDSLNDPYTQYMTKDEWKDFKGHLDSDYCGIGVVVTKTDINDYLMITSTLDDSPAKEAGLDKGDKIIAVEGVTTKDMYIDDIVSKIKGEENTTVKITVQKSGSNNEVELEILRKRLDLITVDSQLLENNIGYLSLTSFNENCSVKFKEHFNSLIEKGASSVIIDLRGNGGGLTNEAEAIANLILPKNSVIYSTKNRAGKTNIVKTKSDGNTDIPIVVLVDSNTASASEILASCIKENGRGVLVGTKTFGKGLVQTVFNFSDNSALKVTIEQYFTANGNDINELGIEPDYPVELLSADDEQLAFAKTLLSK